MTNSNNVNDMVKMLPTGTKQMRFNIGEGGTIENYSFTELTDMKQNDITACNILISAILTNFGIDIRSIARMSPDITSTTPVVVDIENLLMNSKWDTTEITIDSVTKTAMEWIKYRFQIYSKNDFITNLYRRLNDFIMSSPTKDETLLATIDEEAYLMVKLIALCFGANIDFMSVSLGADEIINIPFDKEHLDRIEDYLYDYLKDNGYINPDYVPSVSFPQQLYDIFTNTPLDSDNYFQYCHIQILKSKETGAWILYGYITHEEIAYLTAEPVYYNNNGGWGNTVFTFSSRPWTSDGLINETNLCGFVSAVGNGRCIASYQQNSTSQLFAGANSNGYRDTYSVWCRRSNFTDPETSIHYNELCYNGDGTNGVTDTSWSSHLNGINFPYYWQWNYNEAMWQSIGKWNGSSWAWNGGAAFTTEDPASVNYTYDVTKSEKIDVIKNNQMTNLAPTVPAPTTDDSIYDEINHIDILDLLKKFIFKIDWDSIDWLIKDKTSPYDIDGILNTRIIDVNRGVNLRTGVPITNMKEDITTEYSSTFSSKVEYYNGAKNLCKSPFEYYTVFISDYEMQTFSDAIWDKSLWDKITESFANFTLLDCVKSLIMLPFKLSDPDDYKLTRNPISFAGKIIDEDLKGHELKTFVKVLNTYPIAIGGKIDNDEHISGDQFTKKFSKDPDTYLNYEPYSQASIYIPFVGERNLELSLIWNKMVYLEYIVFVPTGDFVANVLAYDYSDNCKLWDDYMGKASMQKGYPVMTCNGNMAIKFPIAGREQANVIGGMTGALTGVLGGVGGIATGNVAGGIGSIVGGASGLLTSLNGNVRVNGSSMDTNFAYLNNLSPYITLYGHECIKGYKDSGEASAFNQTIGMKAERGVQIAHMSPGFHKVKGIKIDGLKCTDKEKEMIEQILTNGFYYAGDNEHYMQPSQE